MKNNIIILSLFLSIFLCFSCCSLAAIKADFPDSSRLQKMPDGITADISQNIDSSNSKNNILNESNSGPDAHRGDILQKENAGDFDYIQQDDTKNYSANYFNKYVVFFVIFTFFLTISAIFIKKNKRN